MPRRPHAVAQSPGTAANIVKLDGNDERLAHEVDGVQPCHPASTAKNFKGLAQLRPLDVVARVST